MRDERRGGRRAGAGRLLAAGLALTAAIPSQAAAVSGQLQVQYQRQEQQLQFLGPDGILRSARSRREIWTQTYELRHTVRYSNNLSVFSQLRLNEISQVKSAERTRAPYGTLRLAHPWFGLAGSHQPVTITTPVRNPSFFPSLADTAPREYTTFRTRETQFSGYVSAPRAPRLDVSWVRRQRDASVLGAGQSGLSRNLAGSWAVGPLSLRGGYNDLGSGGSGLTPATVLQRSGNGGAALHLAPRPGTTVGLDYDFTRSRRGLAGSRNDVARTHAAALNAGWTASPRVSWGLNYGFRRSLLDAAVQTDVTDHEGALLVSLQPWRSVRAVAGGGLRTSHVGVGTALLRYASAIASWTGAVRPGWTGNASLSHVTNWNPGEQTFSIDTWHAGSRATIRRGVEATVDWQVSDNGDTTARELRWTTQGSWGVQLTPVPGFTAAANARLYNAGPGLFRRSVSSRGATLDLRWRPLPALRADASFSRSGALPHNDPRLGTTLLNVHWNPDPAFQLTGSYTRSTQSQLGAQQLVGREVFGGRVTASLGRTFTITAGLYEADHGRPNATRQVDASVARSFGR
jgi:hypothetical protein